MVERVKIQPHVLAMNGRPIATYAGADHRVVYSADGSFAIWAVKSAGRVMDAGHSAEVHQLSAVHAPQLSRADELRRRFYAKG